MFDTVFKRPRRFGVWVYAVSFTADGACPWNNKNWKVIRCQSCIDRSKKYPRKFIKDGKIRGMIDHLRNDYKIVIETFHKTKCSRDEKNSWKVFESAGFQSNVRRITVAGSTTVAVGLISMYTMHIGALCMHFLEWIT